LRTVKFSCIAAAGASDAHALEGLDALALAFLDA
jgi:hypothetical protein